MTEWKSIPEFENYFISFDGQIRSVFSGKLRKLRQDKDGYLVIVLVKDKKQYYRMVHRLVASAFIPNPKNLPEVNHKDGVKNNNKGDNLEWVTSSENHLHKTRTLKKQIGEQNNTAKLCENDVLYIYNSDMSSRALAKKFNISKVNILSIKNKKTWRHLHDRY
jgi:hypothetical protein